VARKPNLIGLEKGRRTRSKRIRELGGKPMSNKERYRMNAKKLKKSDWSSNIDDDNIYKCKECFMLFNDLNGSIELELCKNCITIEGL
tara:strand:- start:685 stop:948 length:264 start_codon:yes stop_codon:yes gene_type:complete